MPLNYYQDDKDQNQTTPQVQQPVQQTAYQANLAKPAQPQQTNVSTRRDTLGQIYKMAETDPERAKQAYSLYNQCVSNPNSSYYSKFSSPTNDAVNQLAYYGIDGTKMNRQWFDQNKSWQSHLLYNGTSNTPTKPGKKASDDEWKAYWTYQIWKSEDATESAENEWAALKEELAYKAKRKDRNYSDDEIIDSINWSKYSTLKKMQDDDEVAPIELNRAIGFSRDDMYGVMWAARNGIDDTDNNFAMGMSALGEGVSWKDDPELRAKLNYNDVNTYSPYSVGMTLDEDVGLYFGVSSFDQKTLDQIRRTIDPNDETAMSMYNKAMNAWNTTQKAEGELDALYKRVNKWMADGKSEEFILKQVDKLLGTSDYSTLKAMDDSIQTGSGLVQTTKAIPYKRQEFEQQIKDAYAQAKASAADLAANGVNAPTADDGSVRAARIKDQQTRDNLAIFDDDATPEESAAFSGYSSSQDAAQATLADTKTNATPEQVENIYTKQTGQFIKGYMEGTAKLYNNINDYENTQLSLDNMTATADALRAKLGVKEFAGMHNNLSYETEINGNLYRVTMAPDLSGVAFIEEIISDDFSVQVYEIYDDEAIWDEVRNSDELAAHEEAYRLKEKKIAEADSMELTDADLQDIETLRRTDMQIEDAKKYLRFNKDQYDKDVTAYQSELQRLNAHMQNLVDAGADTSDIEVANTVMKGLTDFSKYEATVWSNYNPTYAYTEAIKNGEKKEDVLKQAEIDYNEAAEEIKDIEWMQQYCKEHNIQLPKEWEQNMQRRIEKHKRDMKDYEYFKLQWSKDFDSVAKIGMAEEYENRKRKSMLGISTPLDNMTEEEYYKAIANNEYEEEYYATDSLMQMSAGMANLMTEDEQKTWYYLKEKDKANGTNEADYYIAFLMDPTYGVLWTRRREENERFAAELTSSGAGGFLAANAIAVMMSPYNAVASGAYRLYTAISGDELNPNSGLLGLSHMRNATREQSAEEILHTFGEKKIDPKTGKETYEETTLSKIAQGGYEILTNRLDSAANAAAFGWMFGGSGEFIANLLANAGLSTGVAGTIGGMIQEFLSASPMGLSASMEAAARAKEKGASDAQAYAIATYTFFAETATEAISLDNMKEALSIGEEMSADTFKTFMKNWLTSAGLSEAFGESLNDIIENFADEKIMGVLSEHTEAVEKYRSLGYDKEEAEAMARRDEINGVLRTALISYLSPGLDVFQTIKGRYNYYKGKTIDWNKANPNNKKTLREIRKETLQEQKTAKEEEANVQAEREARPVEEMGDIKYDELAAMTGKDANAEARAEQIARQKKNADSMAVDFEILETGKEGDRSAQNSSISAVLDETRTEESKDEADAAAAMLHDVLGEGRNANSEIQDLLTGATTTNADIPQETIKQGIRYAALSEISESRRVMQSDEYQKATPAMKATMLAEAVKIDQQNLGLTEGMAKKVRDFRIARAEAELVANPEMATTKITQEKIDEAEAKAIQKEGDTLDMQRQLDNQRAVEQSAFEAARTAGLYSDAKTHQAKLGEASKQNEVRQNYERGLENAKREEKAAKEKVEKMKQQRKADLRQQAVAMIDEQDQQRAQAAAEQKAIAEQEAKAKAEQERTLNEQEASEEQQTQADLEQSVRKELEEIGYTGEELDRQVQRVMGWADQKGRKKENMNTRLSEGDGEKFLRKISRRTGITYEMRDLGDPRKTRGQIIDRQHMILNSRLTKGQALVEAALHEVTHGLEDTKAYSNYASFVLNAMYGGENTKEYNDAIERKIKEYAENFKGLSAEEAKDRARRELVAEYARLNLGKKEFVRGITAQGLAGKFREILSDAIAMLRGYTLDAEGKAKYQELRTAMKLLNDAVNERAKQMKQSNNGHTGLVQMSITGWTDATGLTLEVTGDDSHMYRLKNNGEEIKPGEYKAEMVKGTPVGNLIEMAGKARIETLTSRLERGKMTKTEYNKQLKEIANTAKQQREYVAQIINMIGQYQDAAMVWELAGSLAFSSLKTNGDPQYSDSYDFGTICTKTQAILNVISQTQVDLGRALTKAEIDGIVYEEVGKGVQKDGKWVHGATPCPPCYVYATWVNKPARLEKVRLYQNECANWTNEQINEFMNRPAPEGRTQTETKELKTEQNTQKLWISLCLADEVTDPKTGETSWVRKENPDICPNEILLDLRRSGDMATQHPGTWTFMQKGGNAQGKAIAPYSDARLGESIVAKAIGAGEANARLLEDERNAGNSEYIPQFLNPFLSSDPNDQAKAEEYFRKAIDKIKAQNLKGGQRWQSWSDFRAEWGSDYLMEMITMQALGSQVQTYTKVVEALDMLASAGFEVNMSLMPHGDGFWHNEDGSIKVDEDGNLMLRFSNVTGINPEAAEFYARKYGEKGNVQPMVVGISDEHIKAALAGNYITFVIPFHGSGGSVQRLQHLMSLLHEQMDSGNDYTKAQSDEFEHYITEGEGKNKKKINTNPNWAIREKILTGEYKNATDEEIDALNDPKMSYLKKLYEDRYLNRDSDAFEVFFSKGEARQIYPYEYWDTNTTLATADENSKRFIAYCQLLGVKPRFSGLTKTEGKGKNAKEVEYANFSGRKEDEAGNVTYNPVKGYWKLLIDRSMYNRVYDENGKIIPEKCTYHKPQAVSTADINIGAMPQAANNTVGHSDDDTREITERVIQRIEMTSGQNAAAGSAVDLQQNAETLNKTMYEGSEVQNSQLGDLSNSEMDNGNDSRYNYSTLGDLSDNEMDQLLDGILKRRDQYSAPLEGENPILSSPTGPAQRQFGQGTLQESDEIDQMAKDYVLAHNGRGIDTNEAQINRAIQWIRGQKRPATSDGFYEAMEQIDSDDFDYRSADGQARMIAVMGMAVAKGDAKAQARLADAFNRQGTDLGRALQARKLFRLMTPEGRKETLKNMLDKYQTELNAKGKRIDLKFSDWVYQAAAAASEEGDFEKVRRAALNELAEQIPASWKDRVRSLRMLAMLANPRTHIRNLVGNMLFVPAVTIKNKLGAIGEIVTGQQERTKTLAFASSKEIRDFARQDANNIKDILTGEAKFSEATQIAKAQSKLGAAFDWLSEKNSNALEAEDWFFLKGHYRRALGGWMTANGYTVEQVQNDQALLEKGRAYAVQEAQKATYRDFNKTAAVLNEASRKGGVVGFMVDAALPFKKTPANILRRGIEYSPVGIVKALTSDMYHMKQYLDYQNGKLNALPEKAMSPNQVIDDICSGLSGTAIMALGFLLAGTGAVSCGLDDDDDKFGKEKGEQEYAINLGMIADPLGLGVPKLFGEDVTYTMDWAAPMSMPFFVGAAIRNQSEKEGSTDVEGVLNAIGAMSEPVFNLSMLDGINTLFKTSSYDDTNPITQIGAKIATNYVSSYIPSVLGAVSRTFFDDKQRKAFVEQGKNTGVMGTIRYTLEQMQNKIPGLAQQNIAARDIWGNEKTTEFMERLWENFISPGYIEHVEDDPIINEMARVYEATGSTDTGLVPSEPGKSISYTRGGVTYKKVLTDKEWDQYKAVRGQTAFQELTELINSEAYQNALPSTQAQMIKSVWNHADKIGKNAVDPGFDVGEPTDVATIAQDSKISNYKTEIVKALRAEDYDAYETMVEAMYEEYDDQKDADSAIRTKIGDAFRDEWKKAYRDGDYVRMNEIEDLLDYTGYDFNIYGKGGWQEKVDEKYGS